MSVRSTRTSILLGGNLVRTPAFLTKKTVPQVLAESNGDLFTLGSKLSSAFSLSLTPETYSPISIGAAPIGNVGISILGGSLTYNASDIANYFTSDADHSSVIVVNGDLTIPSGQTFIPSVRKLFTFLFVTGNLTLNGALSMSQRGGKHPSITTANLKIHTGTFSGVTDPIIPGVGANGGAGVSVFQTLAGGNAGANGTDGQTGGGGSGGCRASQIGTSASTPAGRPGTGFSGGTGSGGVNGANASSGQGEVNGGKGGNAGSGGGGGAGNPLGDDGTSAGLEGTGGILIVIVNGTFSGTGTVTAAGGNGKNGSVVGGSGGGGGAGSGGGSVTIMTTTDTSSITPSALGGSGGDSGGAGGNGTARKLAL
jgi:hypothetical protein